MLEQLNQFEKQGEGFQTVSLPPMLSKASWEQLLLHLVPSWQENGTQLPQLKWSGNQITEKDKIEKVPGWQEKGTQLLRKKVWYIIGILSLSTKPIGFHKMIEYFDYKNEKSFRDNYVKPLREIDFITMSIPDKPTDPENKYVITEKGKAFLTGQFSSDSKFHELKT